MIIADTQYCFSTAHGEKVYLFTLTNANGTAVDITNYGAIITAFRIRGQNEETNDIVLGFDNPADYLSEEYLANYPYFGAAIGRYANRVANASFKIDNNSYKISSNVGTNQLHGGFNGFDKKVWTVDSFSHNTLVLKYRSVDGEEGYPGTLDITISFELTTAGELVYEYHAVTDKPTAINLTHHSYFNLDNGSGTIADHYVKLNAALMLEQNADFTVTGELVPVKNTIYDFTSVKKISDDWLPADGYDQSFVINADKENTGLHFAAEAFSKRSGIKLAVFTSEPVVHFYTGKWMPFITGKKQQPYSPFSGLCFETQQHPNAINIPHFPETILRPGQVYHTKTMYKVSLEVR